VLGFLDPGSMNLSPGSWAEEPGSWTHDLGSRILDAGSRILGVQHPRFRIGFRTQDPGYNLGGWIKDP